MPPPDPDSSPLSAPSLSRWFAEEVQPHEPALRAWLRSRFPTLADADDLVQESYSRLLKARGTGSIACAKAFLFVTARNLALNQLRHLRHERPDGVREIDASGVLDESAAIPDSVARAEDLQLLIRAIQSLPDRCRQIVTLRKIYGLSQKEVAARLSISEHTVEAQGAIGLRKCIEYFRRHGYRAGVR
jgi:RNA polymerase sigma factor (sigma-70 family)